MAWIESHQALEKHPKILQLAAAMGWSIDEALGKIHRFWWWCLDYAPTGDLRTFDALSLAYGIGLVGEQATRFTPAMLECKLICRQSNSRHHWRVHDWIDYAGTYLRGSKFKRSPEKYQRVVELYSTPCKCSVLRQSLDSPRAVRGLSSVPTNPPTKQPDQPSSAGGDKSARQGRSLATWESYRSAYRTRYGVDPVRNRKTNSLLCQVVDKLGEEEAPKVAKFYLTRNKPSYVSSKHAPDLLSRDAEGLRTEWATGVTEIERPRSVAEML